jgi:hypothetical protein
MSAIVMGFWEAAFGLWWSCDCLTRSGKRAFHPATSSLCARCFNIRPEMRNDF